MFSARSFRLAHGVARSFGFAISSACQHTFQAARLQTSAFNAAPAFGASLKHCPAAVAACARQIRMKDSLLPRIPKAAFSSSPKPTATPAAEAGGASASAAAAAEAPAANVGMMAAVLGFPKAQPFAFNIIVATLKTSVADLMTQMVVERKELHEVDWVRNGVFVVFGAVYLGGFQYWLQVTQFRKMFPTMDRFANQSFAAKLKDTAGMIDTVKQVFFDVFIHLPLMYFPTFYAVKEFVQGDSWNPADWVVNGCTKYYNNSQKDLTAMFMVWFPSDIVIFAVPIWLRLPSRHAVSLAWTSYLSFLRGGSTKEVAPIAEGK